MTVNDVVELTCEAVDLDGRGTARHEARTVSCADWLPGERARVAIEHRSPHRATDWGRVVERLGPDAPERIAPACPGFGRCGGCRLQHMSGEAQRRLKRRRVVEALVAAGLDDVAVGPVTAAPAALGYRNKGKYVVAAGVSGPVIGAYEPRTHQVASTLGCRVVDPAIDAAAVALVPAIARSGIAIYDERARTGELRYAIIRAGAAGEVVVLLVTRTEAARTAIESVVVELGAGPGSGIAGVAWSVNRRDDGGLLDGAVTAIAGDVEVGERAGDVALRLPVTSFAQVNRAQAARIVERLIDALDPTPGERIVDAYAGAGAIALPLAARGARVTAVEIEPTAVDACRRAADAAGLSVDAVAASWDDAGPGLLAGADAVVVNPPRRGLSDAARAALAAGGCPRVAYVSCGPESLARDLAALVAAGYQIESVEPFDLMPGTPEVETLALLRRLGGRKAPR